MSCGEALPSHLIADGGKQDSPEFTDLAQADDAPTIEVGERELVFSCSQDAFANSSSVDTRGVVLDQVGREAGRSARNRAIVR